MHAGVWEAVVEALADDYRVTVMDLPGHGFSRGFMAHYTLPDLSQVVAAVAPASAIWVGWSFGGLIAQRLAIDRPERVTKLVLVASSPCFVRRRDWPHAMQFQVLRMFAETLGRDYQTTLRRFLALEVHGSEHATEQLRLLRKIVFQHGKPDTAILSDALTILENEDLRGELKHIRCPTLLLMGRRDSLVPASAGAAIQTLLPDARLQVFAKAGHAPFFSHLAEFVSCLRVFLNA
jgi:pimeloyl-[acyl-carrier protein] methyl ester esterase